MRQTFPKEIPEKMILRLVVLVVALAEEGALLKEQIASVVVVVVAVDGNVVVEPPVSIPADREFDSHRWKHVAVMLYAVVLVSLEGNAGVVMDAEEQHVLYASAVVVGDAVVGPLLAFDWHLGNRHCG